MAKDPAFLFYPNDYIGGTMGMTFEEKGAYIELLVMQFNVGRMGGHMVGQLVGRNWDKISHKFEKDENGLYYNKRLEEEINKRKAYSDSRKNNLKGNNQYTKKSGHMGGHTTSHMENRNENKDIIINKDLTDFQKKVIEFEEYRRKIKKPIKEASKEYFLKKLYKLSNGNESVAIEILDTSIANGWQGIFELKTQNNGNSKKQSAIDNW